MAMLVITRGYTQECQKKREGNEKVLRSGMTLQDLPGECVKIPSSQVFKIHADAGKMLYSNLYSGMDQGQFHGTPKQIFKKTSNVSNSIGYWMHMNALY